MIFLGLLVLENRLKPETLPVIRTLKDADVRTIMVTGQITLMETRPKTIKSRPRPKL